MGAVGRADGWLRLGGAVSGTAAYLTLMGVRWSGPRDALYDVPTLAAVFGYGGGLLARLVRRPSAADAVRAGALAAAGAVGAGVEFGHWPLSGHLTVATTTAAVAGLDAQTPASVRAACLAPPLCLAAIRTWWPASPLMANRAYTVAGFAAGAALGLAAALAASKLSPTHPVE